MEYDALHQKKSEKTQKRCFLTPEKGDRKLIFAYLKHGCYWKEILTVISVDSFSIC